METVNQNQDAPGAAGNFNETNGKEDEPIPGIPGWGGSTDGIAGEYIALLDLAKGSYQLGVNSDDGFQATIGSNFGDLGSQFLGEFNGGRGASDTLFDIVVTEAGLYPFRVLWFEGGGGANVEIFSMVNGEKFKITYYAKKHSKFIERNGKWDEKCKYWFSKSLKPLITYFDVDANNYRTASGSFWVKRGGTHGDS